MLCLAANAARSQTPAVCALPQPVFVTGAPNIFNDQQEQDLGDALAQQAEQQLHLLPVPANDELTRIGEHLLAQLPPTGIHYTFRIYDSGEINGFSLAGGRVYISRKLIAAVKDEDELAGVLAHEIGHLSTHQTAIAFTRLLRLRLGITQVTDRADIFAKVHLAFSTPPKSNEEEDKEKKDQLVADRVSLYAMVRAGYAPQSFSSFLDASMLNKGKTGSWLTDAFGITQEASQRYRAALKLIAVLPPGCKQQPAPDSTRFMAWKRSVVEERGRTGSEDVAGDRPLKLDPPLRPSPWRIRFSPDGKYVLVQDDGSISVVDRAAAKVLFRVDAPDAEAGQFTPDSQQLLVYDSNLRIERWSVPGGQRVAVKEMVVYDGCTQSVLSPDGNTLVCLGLSLNGGMPRVGLRIIDVESGKALLDKPSFYDAGGFTPQAEVLMVLWQTLGTGNVASVAVSPDGRYVLVATGPRVLAWDFKSSQPVALGGKLKEMEQSRMAFVAPDRLCVIGSSAGHDLYHMRVLSFPDGQVTRESQIGNQHIDAVTHGGELIVGPLKSYAEGILDLDQDKIIVGTQFPAIDLWDKYMAVEDPRGGLILGDIGTNNPVTVPLPLGPLPPTLRAADISADGRYLALSLRNRGQIWSLENGKKLSMMRPFRSVWIDDGDAMVAQFPKYLNSEAVVGRLPLSTLKSEDLGKFDAQQWQYRDLQVIFKPLGHDKSTQHHATLEVRKLGSETVAWSREFAKETPACWPADGDRMVLAWDLSSETAQAEIKERPLLQHELQGLKDRKKGMLLEAVVPETGDAIEQVVLPEAHLGGRAKDERRARLSGEFVLTRGEHGNTAIYRMQDGTKVGEFFGEAKATSVEAGLIAATNREDEFLLVDIHTGKELERFTLSSPIRLAQIVPPSAQNKNGDKNGALIVLTADQTIHRLPLPANP